MFKLAQFVRLHCTYPFLDGHLSIKIENFETSAETLKIAELGSFGHFPF
jgi:hypothetical protein